MFDCRQLVCSTVRQLVLDCSTTSLLDCSAAALADPRCYLITHAHLDHALSLIMLSGSIPPRHTRSKDSTAPPVPACIPVYATKDTLHNLAEAYGGGLWPELGQWAPESESMWTGRRKRRKPEHESLGAGAKFSP